MEQPLISANSSAPKETTTAKEKAANNKRVPPSSEEVLAHYKSQGLEPKEASLKAISDLQTLLFRSASSSRSKKDRLMTDSARKIDNVNTRLEILEMKLDSKPGILEFVAIGVASGAVVQAIGSAVNMWNSVKNAANGNN